MERSAYFEKMTQELIDNEELLVVLKAQNAKVVCVCAADSMQDKGKRVTYATIEKIPPKFSWATDADAMITVYLGSLRGMSEKQKKIVLLRELLKLVIDDDSGNRKIVIKDFDLLDFRCIVERYGVNWDQEPGLFDEVE